MAIKHRQSGAAESFDQRALEVGKGRGSGPHERGEKGIICLVLLPGKKTKGGASGGKTHSPHARNAGDAGMQAQEKLSRYR